VGHSTASAAPATVEAFDLDVFEVTVGRFKAFVKSYSSASIPAEGAGAHPKIDGSGWFSAWNTSLPADPTTLQARLDCHSPDSIAPTWNSDDPTRPINCVDWYTAFAFCIWDGGYLPTGVEWEYAAAGGSLLRDYPWGDMPPPDSTLASWGCAGCTLSPVGSFPPGKARWGHLDLAGNAREWSLSWFIKDPKNCPNCQEFGPDGTYKNSRGGGVNSGDPAALLTTTVVPSLAGGLDPSGGWQRFSDIGFRCAYNSK
jgi:formylglycine-generating enzyme required for sulfatase activity